LSKHFIATDWRGKYRHQNMYVATDDGRIEYVAAMPHIVEQEMLSFFQDIKQLSKENLSIEEVFFYAAMIHLVFVKIHPWSDGNGRSARLIEKWFLAEKLGSQSWFIQSEKMYYQFHQTYYRNIRALGLEYPELEYKNALPFILMLPNTILKS